MMTQAGLRHVVLCAFHEDMPERQGAELVREFAHLKEVIPQVRHFEYGENVSPEGLDDGYTHCFTLIFDSACQRDSYLSDPAHLRFVDLLKPWLAKVLVFDYTPQTPV